MSRRRRPRRMHKPGMTSGKSASSEQVVNNDWLPRQGEYIVGLAVGEHSTKVRYASASIGPEREVIVPSVVHDMISIHGNVTSKKIYTQIKKSLGL